MSKPGWPKFPQIEVPTPMTRMVSDELWFAAQREVRDVKTIETREWLLRDKCPCTHPRCPETLNYYQKYGRVVLHCLAKHPKGRQKVYVSNIVLEELAVICIRNLCDSVSYVGEFGREVKEELSKAKSELARNVSKLKADLTLARGTLEAAMDKDLLSYQDADLQSLAKARLQRMLAASKAAESAYSTAALELQLLTETIDGLDDRIKSIGEYFDEVQIGHPWIPSKDDQKAKTMFDRARSMIKSVNVTVTDKVAVAQFEVNLFTGTLAGDVTRKIQIEHPGILARNEWRVEDWDEIGEMFETSAEKLTDAEFDSLPPLPARFGHSEQLRFIIDVIVFAENLDLEPNDVLWRLGEQELSERLRLLRSYGGLSTLVDHLQKTRGLSFSLTVPKADPKDNEKLRLVEVGDPILVLRICDPMSGQFELTDQQWNAIADIFTGTRKFQKVGQGPRHTLDAYFAIVRENLPANMADRVGADAGSIKHLTRNGRVQLAEATVRLLKLEGYNLPQGFAKARRRKGSPKASFDCEAATEEIRDALPRISVEGSEVAPTIGMFNGLSCNLSTLEVFGEDGNRIDMPINARLLLCRFVRTPNEVVSHLVLRHTMAKKDPRREPHLVTALYCLRRWLDARDPKFKDCISTVRSKGYMLIGDVTFVSADG